MIEAIPLDMTEDELLDNNHLCEMIDFLLLNVLDAENIRWMTKQEIIDCYLKYAKIV